MKAIRVHQHGGPEALVYDDLPTPVPGPGQALVKVEAAGVNFIDTYHRTGLYPRPLPLTLGLEAAGVVEAVGEGVSDIKPGDRVASANLPGAYAEYAAGSADQLVRIPDGLDAELAAAAMLQGLTAHYLVYSTYPVKPGDRVLVHAAAGGLGLLMVQLASRLGATVYGTTSSVAKAELAREAGATEVILYTEADFEEEVKRRTGGRGVDVVYDLVGKATYAKSLNSLRPRGMLVLVGNASGAVPPIDPLELNRKGSLYLTRPTLGHYTATREELLWRANEVLEAVARGDLQVRIDSRWQLADAAEAHRRLESRASAGKLLIVP